MEIKDLSRDEILSLDPLLFSVAEKRAYIEQLFGKREEWTWKNDLERTKLGMLRWERILSSEPATGERYRISHQHIIALSKIYPPEHIKYTVSDFTDWIYELYIPEKDEESLARGRYIERMINRKRIERQIARKSVLPLEHDRWKCIHSDIGVEYGKKYKISSLDIEGNPLRGSPDLVFREKRTGRILIVEIKVTEAIIPRDGWPNLRAQLWAYSQIDDWKDAPEILLVGECWGYEGKVRLRRTMQWKSSDTNFNAENQELFDIYKSSSIA